MAAELEAPTIGNFALVQSLGKTPLGERYLALENHKKKVMLTLIDPKISSKENFIVRFELLKQIWPKLKHSNIVQTYQLSSIKNLFYIVQEWIFKDSSLQTIEGIVPSSSNSYQTEIFTIFENILNGIKGVHSFKSPLFREGSHCDSLSFSQIYLPLGNSCSAKIGHIFDSFLIYGEDPFRYLHLVTEQSLIDKKFPNMSYALMPKNAREGKEWSKLDSYYTAGQILFYLLTRSFSKGIYQDIRSFNPLIKKSWNQLLNSCLSESANSKSIWSALSGVKASLQDAKVKANPLSQVTPPNGMSLIFCENKVFLGACDGPLKEQPQFKANIPPFFIDRSPVTVKQFKKFIPSYVPSSHSAGPDHPATHISYKLAIAYCHFRSDKDNLPRGTFRLPTEYEWEAACRGGLEDQFPWGTIFERGRAHLGHKKNHGAICIQELPKGHFQLLQMLGNVWEWTSSIYKPHPFSKHQEKDYKAELRVIKGGAWWTPIEECRASTREGLLPHTKRPDVGFRCICQVPNLA